MSNVLLVLEQWISVSICLSVQQGALYGGAISLMLVVYIGIMSLLRNGEVEPLPLSLETCECFVSNTTLKVDFHQQNARATVE